jgi:hypothetical protein
MVTMFDAEYKGTKRIKQGLERLGPPFDELARWIEETWQVKVLNAIYERGDSSRAQRPRLQIIVESHSDRMKFHSGFNYDSAKQQAVKDRFLDTIVRKEPAQYDVDGLFVIFSAFAPIALEEADAQITDDEINALKVRVGNPDLWEISRCFGRVTFFFFTTAQLRRHVADGKKIVYAKMYFDILKAHDEFGYLDEKTFAVDFDSKQNFDENFGSSWFYYYR